MNIWYLEIALFINKKLYDEKIISYDIYEDTNKCLYKRMRSNGFI